MAREYVLRAVALSTMGHGDYVAVTQGDESHVVDMREWKSGLLSQVTPECGRAVPVGAYTATGAETVTCLQCISIMTGE